MKLHIEFKTFELAQELLDAVSFEHFSVYSGDDSTIVEIDEPRRIVNQQAQKLSAFLHNAKPNVHWTFVYDENEIPLEWF